MRALIDTNILLDLALDRAPFADDAEQIWEACRAGRFEGYVSAMSLPNVFYIVRKAQGPDRARQAVSDVLAAFDICALDSAALHVALNLPIDDYEDAAQLAGALSYSLDAIVTRDLKDFEGASLPILSPADFLSRLPAASDVE
jgi:predicted nucleic acid-binding protein